MGKNKNLHILNLCEKIPESLRDLFAKLECEIFSRESAQDYESLDFVLTESEEATKTAANDFNCEKNEINIICLGPVKETRAFLLENGRLSIDPKFLESKLGEKIFLRFFTKEYNIHLDESFTELFPETENFKITNHLALGASLDELALKAFESDFNIVALRSFVDHALIYFTYLKQAGLAGVPFEVEYASSSDYFAVNIHAPVKNFTAEYLLDSFGSVNSKDPIQYLLGVTARACDFLDVTHVEKPGRLVLGGFWSKSSKRRLGGLAFNNILTTAQISSRLDRKLKAYRPADEAGRESSRKVEKLKTKSLPGGILAMALSEKENSFAAKEPEKASNLIAFAIGRFEEVYPDHSINDMSEADLNKILGEHPDQELLDSLSEEDREDLLDKIQKKNITDAYNEELQRARDNLKEDEEFAEELSDSFSEEVSKRVSRRLDADALNRIMGAKEEDEGHQRIGGQDEADNFKAVVKGVKENKKGEFAQRISGGFESNAGEFKLKVSGGSGQNAKKGLFDFVNSTISGIDDIDLDPRAKKFFKQSAPAKIAKGLEDFAKSLQLDIADLDESHLLEFKETVLPNLVEETLSDEVSIDDFIKGLEEPFDRSGKLFENPSPEFRDKFREKLQQRVDEIDGLEMIEGSYVFTDETLSQEKAQEAIQMAMKEAMHEEYRFSEGSKEEIEAKEKLVIEEFSKTFAKESADVAEMIKGASEKAKEKETQKVVSSLFSGKPEDKEDENSSFEEAQLMKRLKLAEQENKKLKDSLQAMKVKVDAAGDGKAALSRVEDQAKKEIEAENNHLEKDEFEKVVADYEKAVESVDKKALQDLKQGKRIDKAEAEKIAQALEREQKLLASARDAQANIKKLEVEYKKKESLFLSEMQRAGKDVRAKELLVEKVKDSMQKLVEKKHNEAMALKRQNEELNQRLMNDRSTALEAELKNMSKDYASVSKVAEMYKNKVESMLKSRKKDAENNQSEQLASENRTLSRMNIQLENKLNSELRDKKSIESQFTKLKAQEGKLRARASGAESKYQKAMVEIDKLRANEQRLLAIANKKEGGANRGSSKEVEALKAQNAQLQNSLKEMAEKVKGSSGVAQSAGNTSNAKEKRLEQNVKKLNSELAKAKNEVGESKKQMMKMKNEATALKNKIKQLEKAAASKKKAA